MSNPDHMARIVRTDPASPPEASLRRSLVLYALPSVLLLLVAVFPLITGWRTLFLRDVLNTHFGMKWYQAEAMKEGRLPLVDPTRAGGQPHLGNPNTVPLYPDNVFYLFADPFWALNAHFWLHLFVAPAAAYWLARAWSLRREAAWVTAVCYTGSGYFLSTFNLNNLVAPAALAPALIAAALRLGEPELRRFAFNAFALVWALLVFGGDPMTAVVALALALAAVLGRHGRRYDWAWAGASFAAGTLLAAPQWVEFLRILGLSFRGYWGFSPRNALVTSFHPASFTELLLPFPFGPPDFLFWGHAFHGTLIPLLFSLHPGVLALGLLAAAPWRGPAARWAWGAMGAGLFLALGAFNPLVKLLVRLPGADLLRLPIKFWVAVAIGMSLGCGLGAAALFAERGRERLRLALLVLVLLYLVAWAFLTLAPQTAEAMLRSWIPEKFADTFPARERVRWAGSCLYLLALLVAGLATLRLARNRPAAAAPLLVALLLGSQLYLMQPLLAADDVAPYQRRPALADLVPAGSRVVYGDHLNLFGSATVKVSSHPDVRLLWDERNLHEGLHPWSGVRWGLRYEFNTTPEGLDSFLTLATAMSMWHYPDTTRLRLLELAGVEYLVLTRPLEDAALAAGSVELVTSAALDASTAYLYRLRTPAPPAVLVGEVEGVETLNEAMRRLLAEKFDPTRQAVLAGTVEPRQGPPGSARLVEEAPEELILEIDSPAGGALVVQRTHLPTYRATIDGAPARVAAANLHRLAVLVPPGSHTVRIWVGRRPFHLSLIAAGLGLAALLLVPRWLRPRQAQR